MAKIRRANLTTGAVPDIIDVELPYLLENIGTAGQQYELRRVSEDVFSDPYTVTIPVPPLSVTTPAAITRSGAVAPAVFTITPPQFSNPSSIVAVMQFNGAAVSYGTSYSASVGGTLTLTVTATDAYGQTVVATATSTIAAVATPPATAAAAFGALTFAGAGGYQPANDAGVGVALSSYNSLVSGSLAGYTPQIVGGRLSFTTVGAPANAVLRCGLVGGGQIDITLTSEANTYSVSSDAEMATVMGLTSATLGGKKIKLRAGDYAWVDAQWSSRALPDVLEVTSHSATRLARLIVPTRAPASKVDWVSPRNFYLHHLHIYAPFDYLSSSGSVSAITLRYSVDNLTVENCKLYSNLAEIIAIDPADQYDRGYRGLFGSDGGTNLVGPMKVNNNEIYHLTRTMNFRVDGSGPFEFQGNDIHDFGYDGAVFAGRNTNSVKVSFNTWHTPLIVPRRQYLVTNVDMVNARLTINSDTFATVNTQTTVNIGTQTSVPPGGMNLPGVGGSNDYQMYVHEVGVGYTVLGFNTSTTAAPTITSAGTNVYVNKEPAHADGPQFIPGSTAGGDADNIELIGNDLFLVSDPNVSWAQGIFLEDVASSGVEGHYVNTVMALNRGWLGAYNGMTLVNGINCLVLGNSVIEATEAPSSPSLSIAQSWGGAGSGNVVVQNITAALSVPAAFTDTTLVGNIVTGKNTYSTTGVFAGTGGYSPTTLAEFQAAFTRTDIVGVINKVTHTYDVPLLNTAVIAQPANSTQLTVAALTTSPPMLVSAVQNSSGAASAYGIALTARCVGSAPEIRITSDAAGNNVVQAWTSGVAIAQAGQYAWVRADAPASGNASKVVQINAGKQRFNWTMQTAAVTGFNRVASYEALGATADLTALGVQAGDLVLVSHARASNTARTPAVAQAGYTTAATLFANSTSDTNLHVFYKIMDATPDTVVSLTGAGAANDGSKTFVEIWRGVNQSTPLDVAVVTAQGANSRLVNPPAITPVTANAKIIVIGGASTNNLAADDVVMGYGLGRISATASGSLYKVDCSRSYVIWTGGAYDPAAWACTNNQTGDSWAAVTLALRPA